LVTVAKIVEIITSFFLVTNVSEFIVF